jgi:hypothetical protein
VVLPVVLKAALPRHRIEAMKAADQPVVPVLLFSNAWEFSAGKKIGN